MSKDSIGGFKKACRSLKRYILILASSTWSYLSRFGRDLKSLKKTAILIAVSSTVIICAICIAPIFVHNRKDLPAFATRVDDSDVAFWNWDFSNESLEGVRSESKVLYWGNSTFYSTPVTMIFWGNATSSERVYEVPR